RTHDYQKAITEYQAVIRQRPDLAEVHTNLGLVYYLQGMNDDAIAAFQRAVELRPSILGANLFLGMAYVRTNQYQKALEPLRKAPSLNTRKQSLRSRVRRICITRSPTFIGKRETWRMRNRNFARCSRSHLRITWLRGSWGMSISRKGSTTRLLNT